MLTPMTCQTVTVTKAEGRLPACPAPDVQDPCAADLAALRRRAEVHVATLTPDGVAEYELHRAVTRQRYGLRPVPVTDRGRYELARVGWAVGEDGELVI